MKTRTKCAWCGVPISEAENGRDHDDESHGCCVLCLLAFGIDVTKETADVKREEAQGGERDETGLEDTLL